jgi:hypothetical protein
MAHSMRSLTPAGRSICEIWTPHPFMLDDFVIEPKLNGFHVTTSESETSKVLEVSLYH